MGVKIFDLLSPLEGMASPEVRAIHRGMLELFPDEDYSIYLLDPETKAIEHIQRFRPLKCTPPALAQEQAANEERRLREQAIHPSGEIRPPGPVGDPWLRRRNREPQPCTPPAPPPSAEPAEDLPPGWERRTVPLAERGPRWLTAPPGFRVIDGPHEVSYFWDRKKEEWVAECQGVPGQGTAFSRGKTQQEAHDEILKSQLELSWGRGGTFFEKVEESSSGGERCIARGVDKCCRPHPEVDLHGQWCDAMYIFRIDVLPFLPAFNNDPEPLSLTAYATSPLVDHVRSWTECPWCGERLGGEG